MRNAINVVRKGPGFYTAGKPRTLYFPSSSELRFRLRSTMHPLGAFYLLFHLSLIVLHTFGFMALRRGLEENLLVFTYTVASLYIQGCMLNGNRWAAWLEVARGLVVAAALLAMEQALGPDADRPAHQKTIVMFGHIGVFFISAALVASVPDRVLGTPSFQKKRKVA